MCFVQYQYIVLSTLKHLLISIRSNERQESKTNAAIRSHGTLASFASWKLTLVVGAAVCIN